MHRQHRDGGLERAGGAEQVPVHRLGRADAQPCSVGAPHPAQRIALDHVAHASGRAVRVAVAHLGRREPAARQRLLDGANLAQAIGLGHVGGVATDAEAAQLRVDPRAAHLRVPVRLQHQHRGAVAEHEAAARCIERAARRGGIVGVGRGQRLQRLPRAHDAGHDQRFGAAGDRDVDAPRRDGLAGLGDGHRRRRAGHRVGVHRPAGADTHGHVGGRRVGHAGHHGQRGHALLLAKGFVAVVQRGGAPHAAAHVHAHALEVDAAWPAGVAARHLAGGHGHLADAIDAGELQLVEPALGLEPSAGHGDRRHVVAIPQRDRRLAPHQLVEHCVGLVAMRAGQPDAGDDDALARHHHATAGARSFATTSASALSVATVVYCSG